MKTNTFTPEINTRATRSIDASIKHGIIEFVFQQGTIKVNHHHADREMNRQLFADIETTLHKYIGEPINADTMRNLSNELYPITSKLVTIV